jgi:hypothetical protein
MELIDRAVPVVLVVLLVVFCALIATSPLTEADIDRDVHP